MCHKENRQAEEEGRLKKNNTYLSPQGLWFQDSLGLKLAETGKTPQKGRCVNYNFQIKTRLREVGGGPEFLSPTFTQAAAHLSALKHINNE